MVLGANGFIGKNLCVQLIKKYDVRAFDRYFGDELSEIGVTDIVEGDFLTKADFSDLLDGIDTVYHLISTTLPKAGTEHLIDEELHNNVMPTIRLLESMKKMGTKRIIFASSGGTIYGDYVNHPNMETDRPKPKCTYALQKQIIEDCLNFYHISSNMDVRVARISNPYGIGQSITRMQGVIPIFINHLLQNNSITVFGADNRRDYIYMDDVTNALIKLGEYEGTVNTFNIASNEVFSLREVISIIEEISGRKFSNIECCEQREFDVNHVILDTEVARRELNWSAQTSINEGIEKLYNRIRSNMM